MTSADAEESHAGVPPPLHTLTMQDEGVLQVDGVMAHLPPSHDLWQLDWTSAVWSPLGKYFAVVRDDRRIAIVTAHKEVSTAATDKKLREGGEVVCLFARRAEVSAPICMTFSMTDQFLASAHTLGVWVDGVGENVRGSLTKMEIDASDGISALAFNYPEITYGWKYLLAMGGSHAQITLCNWMDGKFIRSVTPFEGRGDEIKSLAFSPRDENLLACSSWGRVRLMKVDTLEVSHTYWLNQSPPRPIQFTPMGDKIGIAGLHGAFHTIDMDMLESSGPHVWHSEMFAFAEPEDSMVVLAIANRLMGRSLTTKGSSFVFVTSIKGVKKIERLFASGNKIMILTDDREVCAFSIPGVDVEALFGDIKNAAS
jgi:hypothetical protein